MGINTYLLLAFVLAVLLIVYLYACARTLSKASLSGLLFLLTVYSFFLQSTVYKSRGSVHFPC